MKKVLIIAPNGFEELELAPFTDILGWTRIIEGVRPVEVAIAGFHEVVSSKHGLKVIPDLRIQTVNVTEYDVLVIPGGFADAGYDEVFDESVIEAIRTMHRKGGIIATMCVGAFPVGKAGLLKGKRATTFYSDGCCETCKDNLKRLTDYGATVLQERIVVDDRIITNIGPAAAEETVFVLLEMLNGKEDAERVKREMMFL